MVQRAILRSDVLFRSLALFNCGVGHRYCRQGGCAMEMVLWMLWMCSCRYLVVVVVDGGAAGWCAGGNGDG